MQLTAVLTHAEEGGFIALNPEEFPTLIHGHPLVTTFDLPVHA